MRRWWRRRRQDNETRTLLTEVVSQLQLMNRQVCWLNRAMACRLPYNPPAPDERPEEPT